MLQVIFQDDALIVFDKPAGLVVDRSETQTDQTLEDILRGEHQINLDRGGIVHRLDKDTSGLIVVAKTQESLENLQAQFKGRSVKKRYLALVHGFVKSGGVIEGSIARNPNNREKFMVLIPQGETLQEVKEAVTEYDPIECRVMSGQLVEELFPDFNKIQIKKMENMRYTEFTLLECRPQTGRTHQIRVHLKHIGFPIVGDGKYGGRKVVRLDHRWCARQFLHAAKLSFTHPTTGKLLEFASQLPDDLKNAWNQLTPYSSS